MLTWGWGASMPQLMVFMQGLSEIIRVQCFVQGLEHNHDAVDLERLSKGSWEPHWQNPYCTLLMIILRGEKMMKSFNSLPESVISCTEWTLKGATWARSTVNCLTLVDVWLLMSGPVSDQAHRWWDGSVFEAWSTSKTHCEFGEFRVLQYPYTACLGRCFILKLIRTCLIPYLVIDHVLSWL